MIDANFLRGFRVQVRANNQELVSSGVERERVAIRARAQAHIFSPQTAAEEQQVLAGIVGNPIVPRTGAEDVDIVAGKVRHIVIAGTGIDDIVAFMCEKPRIAGAADESVVLRPADVLRRAVVAIDDVVAAIGIDGVARGERQAHRFGAVAARQVGERHTGGIEGEAGVAIGGDEVFAQGEVSGVASEPQPAQDAAEFVDLRHRRGARGGRIDRDGGRRQACVVGRLHRAQLAVVTPERGVGLPVDGAELPAEVGLRRQAGVVGFAQAAVGGLPGVGLVGAGVTETAAINFFQDRGMARIDRAAVLIGGDAVAAGPQREQRVERHVARRVDGNGIARQANRRWRTGRHEGLQGATQGTRRVPQVAASGVTQQGLVQFHHPPAEPQLRQRGDFRAFVEPVGETGISFVACETVLGDLAGAPVCVFDDGLACFEIAVGIRHRLFDQGVDETDGLDAEVGERRKHHRAAGVAADQRRARSRVDAPGGDAQLRPHRVSRIDDAVTVAVML